MRTTSETKNEAKPVSFPFSDDRVPFILVFPEGGGKEGRGFEHASRHTQKRALLEQAKALQEAGTEMQLLAAWPGSTRTDVFLVDDLDEALAAFA